MHAGFVQLLKAMLRSAPRYNDDVGTSTHGVRRKSTGHLPNTTLKGIWLPLRHRRADLFTRNAHLFVGKSSVNGTARVFFLVLGTDFA